SFLHSHPRLAGFMDLVSTQICLIFFLLPSFIYLRHFYTSFLQICLRVVKMMKDNSTIVITIHPSIQFHNGIEETPVPSDKSIHWEWKPICPGSALTTSPSSLEILESGMYFVYAYVALTEEASTEHRFSVYLMADSQVHSVFQGPNAMLAFINMGRPYFLKNGIKLHLDINEGLTHIDSNRTYWGILKI
uniref:TNF family profile domain-containing protein n=1 Tax=Podarcis muralis TaxID=64176 RepID=A0A670IHN1_PODMU